MKKILYALALLTLATSCRKDLVTRAEKVDLQINLDLTNAQSQGTQAPQASDFTALVNGVEYPLTELNTVLSVTNDDILKIAVYNKPQGLEIKDGIASIVGTSTTKNVHDSLIVDTNTLWFNSGFNHPKETDTAPEVDIIVSKSSANVSINLLPATPEVSSVQMSDLFFSLSGVPQSVDIFSSQMSNPVVLLQPQITRSEDNALSATIPILGTIGTGQFLGLSFRDATGKQIIQRIDISEQLIGVNGSFDDVSIEGEYTPSTSELSLGSIKITHWTVGDDIDGSIENPL